MTLIVMALGWMALSVISGLFLGALFDRFGADAMPGWDPVGSLDEAAITPLETHVATRHRHIRQ
jgi:hypothetical protein